ncbi:hypothetical protein Pdw03_5126 [Penicillium digitatum]|uniref:Uncharacterized protein n=3 Tax=Penicillium digitatum TaxID=36651 RepID=K9FBD8_PEND2|nr:hypothetical protein PDIP_04230 [Penicillium digitatum Pd1]EKV06514.1 hypothetical protein PDIG_77110 [Penicillium digitatum PHI26]EKV21681.1 hypothetical protein PDIP_04230 [Penicillium digitatum Pd1]QQK47491.1 hypothetical protein Pdw03_5126 [Penicillium digitatum]
MQTRSQTQDQPPQPPKQAAYAQSSNPVSQMPQEQRVTTEPSRHHGDTIGAIKRTAESKPSSDEERTRLSAQHRKHEQELHNAPDVDLEYGVEQQPAEGYIADTVQRKGREAQRAQAGAHAGPVGSAGGPGHPGFGEADDLTANLGAKKVEHDRILDERVKGSPAEPEGEGKAARRGRLERDEKFDVERAVKQVTGDPVVGK